MQSTIEIQDFQQFNQLDFLAKQVVEGFITGLHKSPFHGFSVEFAEHRLYNKGESTRHIDWKLFARTDKLFVKRYEEETNLRSQILIDTSSSMLFPYGKRTPKINFLSVLIAAALIYLLNKQRDAVGLTLFSDNVELHTEARLSSTHTKRLYAELSRLLERDEYQLKKGTSISETLHNIAEQIHKRSLVIIFSDMIADQSTEEIFSAMQHLRHNKHEVILFHVVDKSLEINFDYQNRPYKFIDLETGKSLKLNPNDVRELFKQQSSAAFEELKLKCAQYKIDFVEADIKGGFKEVLIPYLIKRQKLF
ncbi:MAG: DUF58 domain-containing protein [Chloroflexia bacterium]|nr:DUF58 domain-containing protein [Chloroflexia bacterium]